MELNPKHEQCLEALKILGPSTAKEVATYMFKKGYCNILERNMAHPRLNELMHGGYVKVASKKKKDLDTNKMVTVYVLILKP